MDYHSVLSNINENHVDIVDTVTHNNTNYDIAVFSDQCRNALVHKYNYSIPLHTADDDYIWSRESIDAYLNGFQFKPQFSCYWMKHFNSIWFRVLKSGSTSIEWRLRSMPLISKRFVAKALPHPIYLDEGYVAFVINGDNQSMDINELKNILETSECVFTFVRDPIKRFISSYYKIHAFLYNHLGHSLRAVQDMMDLTERHLQFKNVITDKMVQETHSFWSVFGEPQRINAFVDNMIQNPYIFMKSKHIFQHSATQIGWYLGNTFGKNINFIGKIENLEKDWNILRKKCGFESSRDIDLKNKASGIHELFDSWNWRRERNEINIYAKMLGIDFAPNGLNVSWWKHNSNAVNWRNYLSPAYFAIANDEILYNKIVEYYLQDFVCLKYDIDFNAFREYVNSKKNINEIVYDYRDGVKSVYTK